jgi:kynureninase
MRAPMQPTDTLDTPPPDHAPSPDPAPDGTQAARELDARDELAVFREQFYRRPGQVYLDGHSLGLLSRPAEAAVLRVLEEWKALGIEGWLEAPQPWFFMAEELARQTAPLLGAGPETVAVANGTTVNLHQLLATLFQPEGRRTKILSDALAFPSDIYAIQSHLRLRGLDPQAHLLRVPSRDGATLDEAEIASAMTEEVALAVLPSVLFTSGQLLDVAWLARQARARGIRIGFDCSHSIGTLPHRLDEWGVDFAFWCSYKYVGAGPGGTGGLYLNRRHFGRPPGLAGWFSSQKERQFDFAHTLYPAPGAACLQIGTPGILSMAPLAGCLELIAAAGIERIRRKSLALTGYLIALIDALLGRWEFRILTPREPARRGGHVALAHPEAARIARALREAGVIADFRPPDILRLSPVALYTSFGDCCVAVARLEAVMERRAYEGFAAERELVS